MNNKQEQGWDLATIPTLKHNEEVLHFIWASFPNLQTGTDRDFYQVWIGIFAPDSETNSNILRWADKSDFYYLNVTTAKLAGQWGMIDTRSGIWNFRDDPNSYARGLCSRTILCPLVALEHGQVEYEWSWAEEKAVEGTIVKCSCDLGYSLVGEEEMVCGGDGHWGHSGAIPVCALPGQEDASEEPEPPDAMIFGVRRSETAAGKKKKKKNNKVKNKKKGGKWRKNKG